MSKWKRFLVSAVRIILISLLMAGCVPDNPVGESEPQMEATSGPIPVQIEATDTPSLAAAMEMPAVLPSDTPQSSGVENPTDTPVVIPDTFTPEPVIDETVEIQLDWDIYSVDLGETEKINVQAVNSSGEAVPFSIQTSGNCLTVAFNLETITITAGDEMCEQIITVKAANAEDKTLNVIGFDPRVLDIGEGRLIRYTKEYDFVWNSVGRDFYTHTGNPAKLQFGFWHPRANSGIYQEGWYALGSMFAYAPWKEDVPYVASIVVKDSKDDGLLAAPLDYVELDNVYNQGDALVWKAVCPKKSTENVANDYVALGVIATASPATRPACTSEKCRRMP